MGAPLFLVAALPSGGHYRFDGPEGHHAATVQRLGRGEILLLSDGNGDCASCRVTATGKGFLDLEVLDRWTEPQPRPKLTVVQGIAKSDRGELAVQAMTEVGVDTIVPWSAARSVVRWKAERGEKALRRWRSVAREAGKQARRAWQPVVTAPMDTSAVAELIRLATAGYLLHEEARQSLATVNPPTIGEIVLVVGPEGGVTPEEMVEFTAAGAVAVRLGSSVLRTSTAGVAALSVVSVRTGRWS